MKRAGKDVSEHPLDPCAQGYAALLAHPALDGDIRGHVLTHRGFPADLQTAGESLERRGRRCVGQPARAMVGCTRVATELILHRCAEDQSTARLRHRPSHTRPHAVAVHGGEVVAVTRGERRARPVLPRVEIAEIHLPLCSARCGDLLSDPQMCADVVCIRIVGGVELAESHREVGVVVHLRASESEAALVEQPVRLFPAQECARAEVADRAVAVHRVDVAVIAAAPILDERAKEQAVVPALQRTRESDGEVHALHLDVRARLMAQGGAAHCRKGGKARRACGLGGRARKPAVREEVRTRAEKCRRPCHRLGEGLRIVHAGE